MVGTIVVVCRGLLHEKYDQKIIGFRSRLELAVRARTGGLVIPGQVGETLAKYLKYGIDKAQKQ